jgi:hypothetical protein
MQKKLFSELGLAPEMKAIGRMGVEELPRSVRGLRYS